MAASQSNGSAGLATRLTHAGRTPSSFHGFVNPPVAHASTVLFPDTATMLSGKQTYHYARRGNPTTDALEEAIAELEGAAGAKLASCCARIWYCCAWSCCSCCICSRCFSSTASSCFFRRLVNGLSDMLVVSFRRAEMRKYVRGERSGDAT